VDSCRHAERRVQRCGMSMTLRVAAATKATAAAQEARPARAMGLPAVETAWARNGEERAPTSASRFTRDAKVMASCPALEKVRMRRTSPRASARRVCNGSQQNCGADLFSAVAATGTRAVRDTSAGRGKPGGLAAELYVLVV